ncbi:hypothetical protein FOCC_FOCC004983 [Frankliniella occidentalis]|nr:hypothetical protein FOCC_FOCC004983 [Frankliniella occidentalis]
MWGRRGRAGLPVGLPARPGPRPLPGAAARRQRPRAAAHAEVGSRQTARQNQHQLCVRRAASPRAHVSVRKAPLQDRHAAARHRLHRPAQGTAHGRLRPTHLRGAHPTRRHPHPGARPRRMEHKRSHCALVVDQLGELRGSPQQAERSDEPGTLTGQHHDMTRRGLFITHLKFCK